MEQSPWFRTKTGYAHLLPDAIVFTQDGNPGTTLAKKAASSGKKSTPLWGYALGYGLYGFLLCMLAYKTYGYFATGAVFNAVLFSVLVGWMILVLAFSRFYSDADVIDRAAIRSIRFQRKIPYLVRGRFMIAFADETGKLQKRPVVLPGFLEEGDRHTEKALAVMRAEGLLTS